LLHFQEFEEQRATLGALAKAKADAEKKKKAAKPPKVRIFAANSINRSHF